jgi:NAD(P)-dependent dehydrogenase (short-subunit alcohol dehydrogenase family)
MTLHEKTAVVTGGGRGIGKVYCERLAAEGANVVVVDIEDPSPVTATLVGSGDKTAMICDVSKANEITAVSSRVLERFGRCDNSDWDSISPTTNGGTPARCASASDNVSNAETKRRNSANGSLSGIFSTTYNTLEVESIGLT